MESRIILNVNRRVSNDEENEKKTRREREEEENEKRTRRRRKREENEKKKGGVMKSVHE